MRRGRARAGERGGRGAGDHPARPARLLTLVALRPARPQDAGAIAAIYAPHVTSGIASFETEPPDAAAIRDRMTASGGLYPWLVAAEAGEVGTAGDDGTVLGYAYAARFRDRDAYRWMVETSVYLAAGAQGRGVGRLLYDALLASLSRQGFSQAIGTISLPNPASVALHETLGFRLAGVLRAAGFKRGRWIDVGYWQRELVRPGATPAEPRRVAEAEHEPGQPPIVS